LAHQQIQINKLYLRESRGEGEGEAGKDFSANFRKPLFKE
jgi:hypothetical protein